jgi:hypothetical protein
MQGFCLSDKDLEPLSVVHKPNPRSPRSGAPMSLYLQTEVRSVEWGILSGHMHAHVPGSSCMHA